MLLINQKQQQQKQEQEQHLNRNLERRDLLLLRSRLPQLVVQLRNMRRVVLGCQQETARHGHAGNVSRFVSTAARENRLELSQPSFVAAFGTWRHRSGESL